jgi:glutathione S-transferase
MPRILYTMPYSPWSERARFVLLHHGLDFEEREHLPLLGELTLRARAGKWSGKATVPLLVDGEHRVMDSFAIAQHVDAAGEGDKLVEPERLDELAALNAELEPLLAAVRVRLLELAADRDDVALGLAPPFLRSLPLTAASARLGARYIAKKHAVRLAEEPERLRAGLEAIRARVDGRSTVFERFSYADILCATSLTIVRPVGDDYVPLYPGLRQHLRDPDLEAEFADLLSWRDALYRDHRPKREAAAA